MFVSRECVSNQHTQPLPYRQLSADLTTALEFLADDNVLPGKFPEIVRISP